MAILDQHGRPFAPPAPTDRAEGLQLEALEGRQDRWINEMTGIGTAYDKTKHGRFFPVRRLWDPEIVDLVNGSDLAAKGVFKRPEECFREGYDLEARDLDQSAIDDFRQWADETFDLDNTFQEAMGWGAAFGGMLLVLGIDDGRDQSEPVDESRIRDVTFVNKVDRRFAYAQSYYSRLDEPKYGSPETYLISNGVATSAIGRRQASDLRSQGFSIGLVHESRTIRFDGVSEVDATTRQMLAGWSWSVLQRPYEVMRDFDHIFDSVGYLVSDASQAVFKLRGLIQAIRSGGRGALMTRLRVLEETRSVMRGIALDAGDRDGKDAESFERAPTTFTGLPDVMDRFMLRLAAAFDMPAMELFGQGGGGLNAAGEAQAATRKWHESNRSKQRKILAPRLRRAYRLLTFAKGSPLRSAKAQAVRWQFDFKPLQSQTDDEIAKTRLANAQRDDIYLTQGVVKPEEVAVGLGDVYPSLDIESREEAIEAGKSHDPYPADEPAAPEGAIGSVGEEGEGGAMIPPIAGAQLGVPKGAQRGTIAPPPTSGQGALGAAPDGKGDRRDAERMRLDAQDEAARVALDALLEGRRDANAARAVFDQLLADYHAKDLGWVLKLEWDEPKAIPLDQINFADRDRWKASTDGTLKGYIEKLSKGHLKPVIYVKPPDAPYEPVDGHHRTLANEALGRSPVAYTAKVPSLEGPWLHLHSLQKKGSSKTGAAPISSRDASRLADAVTSSRDPSRGASRGDAHDPKRARGSAGRWTEERATAASRDAADAGERAKASGAIAEHLEAARAHATAAAAHRDLAARHAPLGNRDAAGRHERAARGHDRMASEHLISAGTPETRREG